MSKPVEYRESLITIPWCRPGESDTLAPLWTPSLPRGRRVYPYCLNELVGTEFEDREMRIMELENAFLKLTFLPELGGRLISMVDKISNQELLFRNSVLKPVMAGLTGAWCGTGMEFNFPGSHSVTSDLPVCCSFRSGASDGSQSVVISDREFVSGMRWQVTVTLKPDSAAVHAESQCCNRTALPHPGYWWTNAKAPAFPDTEFIFPEYCAHGVIHPPMDITRIAALQLPMVNQIDISHYRKVYFQLPLFFQELRQNTFGLYHREKGYGLLHHADFGELPGRKIWTLGTGDDGQVTNENLTTDGAGNIELQAGPLPVQTDFMLLRPGESHAWTEEWLPLRSMLAKHQASNADFTVSGDDEGHIRIQCHSVLPTVRLITEKQTFEFTPEPGRLFDYAAGKQWRICDGDGWNLLQYSQADPAPPVATNEKIDLSSAEAQYLQGLYREENGQPRKATACYQAALAVDKSFTPALTALAVRKLRIGKVEEARKMLEVALHKNRRSPEISYYLGLCCLRLNAIPDAIFHLERARFSVSWRPAASARLGELFFRLRRRKELERILSESDSQDNVELLEIALLVQHVNGSLCVETSNRLKMLSPENPLPELLAGKTPALTDLRAGLVAVERLFELGLDAMARAIAAQWQNEDPIAAYLAGNIERAEQFSLAGVFPPPGLSTRFEELARAYPEAPGCRYYCGLLRAAAENWQGAHDEWMAAWKLGLRKPELCRNLGLYYRHIAGDHTRAAEFYVAGFDLGSINYRYVCEYDQVLELLKANEQREKLFKELPERLRSNPYVTIRRAAFRMSIGDPAGALAELAGRHFVLCEGKRMTSALFIEANCQLGQQELANGRPQKALGFFKNALSYPHGLGCGRSAGMFDMKSKFLILKATWACGDYEEANRLRDQWLDECERLHIDFSPLNSIRWECGDTAEDALIDENYFYHRKIKERDYEN